MRPDASRAQGEHSRALARSLLEVTRSLRPRTSVFFKMAEVLLYKCAICGCICSAEALQLHNCVGNYVICKYKKAGTPYKKARLWAPVQWRGGRRVEDGTRSLSSPVVTSYRLPTVTIGLSLAVFAVLQLVTVVTSQLGELNFHLSGVVGYQSFWLG